jgi:hypothetical protein
MNNDSELSEAGRLYAAALNAHHTRHDFPVAIQLYKNLIATHPHAPEADLSRTQVEDIASAVKHQLRDVRMELLISHYERDESPDEEQIPGRPQRNEAKDSRLG